jgi:hypothetical protein
MSTVVIALLFGFSLGDYSTYDTRTEEGSCLHIYLKDKLAMYTIEGTSNKVVAETGHFGDNIVADGADNQVWSGKGDDTIALIGSGNIGNGGDGDDELSAFGAGNVMNGDDGDDTLTVIRDSQGTTLEGGNGHDSFVIDVASGDNRIVDFDSYADKLTLTGIDLSNHYASKKLEFFVDHYSYAAALFIRDRQKCEEDKKNYGHERDCGYESRRLIYFEYFSGDELKINDEHYNMIVLKGNYAKLDVPDELAAGAPCPEKKDYYDVKDYGYDDKKDYGYEAEKNDYDYGYDDKNDYDIKKNDYDYGYDDKKNDYVHVKYDKKNDYDYGYDKKNDYDYGYEPKKNTYEEPKKNDYDYGYEPKKEYYEPKKNDYDYAPKKNDYDVPVKNSYDYGYAPKKNDYEEPKKKRKKYC